MERCSEISLGGDPFDVLVPGLARIGAQFLRRLAEQQVPGAFDVIGRERMAVVPFDALAQPERQLAAVLVPRPVGRQIRDDRLQAVLCHILLIHDEVVEDAHHRPVDRARRLLVHRHARRAVEMGHPQDAALFLRKCRVSPGHCLQ
jgi:hypothetical protein